MEQNISFLDAIDYEATQVCPLSELPPWQGYCAKNYSDLLNFY